MPHAAVPQWRQILDAEDAAVRGLAHAALSSRARQLMPLLSAEDAKAMRVAILAGPGHGLVDLIKQHSDLLPPRRLR